MTSTGFLSLQQQESPTQTLSYTSCQSYNGNDNGMHNNNRKLLVDLVRDHHSLYFMEHRDRPNVVARVLVTLHELGGKLNNSQYMPYNEHGFNFFVQLVTINLPVSMINSIASSLL